MTDERREERVGDPAVDAAWRSAAHEEPPVRVDDAILAAARAAVHGHSQASRPVARKPWWITWQPLAAAASVIGLSFLLVQLLPRDEAAAPAESPAAAPTEAPAAKARAESRESAESPGVVTGEKPVADRRPAAADHAAAPPVAPATLSGAAPRAAAPAAAERSGAPSPSPEAWASRIAALHEAGDLAAAADELRAFRAAHADADQYLSEALHPWAASIEDDRR